MNEQRYTFTNFTSESFEGRFGGQPYLFAPGETKEYDPDKHYMLIILSKQLADRELTKGVKGVLRTKDAGNDYGKAIDANGNIYKPSIEMRKDLMREAIGALVDKPIPYPEQAESEAGSTRGAEETKQDVMSLKEEIRDLKEMVNSLVSTMGANKTIKTTEAEPIKEVEETPNIGFTREVLESMAREKGREVLPTHTKDEIIQLINQATV